MAAMAPRASDDGIPRSWMWGPLAAWVQGSSRRHDHAAPRPRQLGQPDARPRLTFPDPGPRSTCHGRSRHARLRVRGRGRGHHPGDAEEPGNGFEKARHRRFRPFKVRLLGPPVLCAWPPSPSATGYEGVRELPRSCQVEHRLAKPDAPNRSSKPAARRVSPELKGAETRIEAERGS